eukprot:SAG11_NODE_22131_length_411_cov_1.320513_1_plen_58_part_10
MGFFGASALGYAVGAHYISRTHIYLLLIALNIPLTAIGLASFSSTPGGCGPEMDPPPA